MADYQFGYDLKKSLTEAVTSAGDAHAQVGPDTVAKIIFTSGSTANPKGVVTTHGMMCGNQAQVAACMPLLAARPPKIVHIRPSILKDNAIRLRRLT